MHLGQHLADHLDAVGNATTRTLLSAEGFTGDQIRRFVRSGRLAVARRGAYIRGDDLEQLTPEQRRARRAVAVARASDDETVISHESALATWALPVLLPEDDRIHTTQLDGARENVRGTLHHHVAPAPEAVVRLPGPWSDVRAVRPEVAVAQVAMRRGLKPGLAAADAALHRGLITRADLEHGITLSRLVRNRAIAREMVAFADHRTESPGESVTRLQLRALGLPPPELQVRVYDDAGHVGRVDFLLEGRGVIEFDGFVKYGNATGADLFREKQREDRLRRLGYSVARLVWGEIRSVSRTASVLRASGVWRQAS